MLVVPDLSFTKQMTVHYRCSVLGVRCRFVLGIYRPFFLRCWAGCCAANAPIYPTAQQLVWGPWPESSDTLTPQDWEALAAAAAPQNRSPAQAGRSR